MADIYAVTATEKYRGKKPSEIPVGEVWTGFMDKTTAHGVPHIRYARGFVKKAFWILATLSCIVILVQQVYVLIVKYIEADVAVKVSVVHAKAITFPAVTICNNNPYLKSQLLKNPEIRDLYGLESDSLLEGAILGPRAVNPTTYQAFSANEGYGFAPDSGFEMGTELGPGGRPQRAIFERSLKLMQLTSAMKAEDKETMGYQINDLIVDCQYSGTVCNVSTDFTYFFNSWHGNCYTFNSNWDEDYLIDGQLARSYRPGPHYDEYVGALEQSAGVKIVVHSQHRMPFPEDESISVSPGFQTFIGITKVSITRQGGRYGVCSSITDVNYKRNVYEELYPVSFSNAACYKTCYQAYVVNACGCGDPQYPINGSFIEYRPVMPCNYSSHADVACMRNVLTKYQNDSLDCDCPTACNETTFNTGVAMDKWPSDSYKDPLYDALASSNKKVRTIVNSDASEFDKNIGKVVIYFQEFNYESVIETPLYTLSSLISDIGGTLGLFIGFSFLTIGEFLELGMDMLIVSLVKPCNRRKPTPKKNGTLDGSQSVDSTRAGSSSNFFTLPSVDSDSRGTVKDINW